MSIIPCLSFGKKLQMNFRDLYLQHRTW